MHYLGFYLTSGSRTHVRFSFPTFASAGGNVAPLSAFEAADLRIYKAADGAALSATQRSSSNGITMTSPFDSLVGLHSVDIDLTDNSDASFYLAGCYYEVHLAPDTETIDSQTITGVPLACFEIGVPTANVTQVGGTAQTAGDLAAMITAVDDFVDTEVAAIKAKTDQLTFTTANQVDARTVSIATDAITAASIQANAIGASEIADGAIDAATFAAGAIDSAAIAADAIGSSELATTAVNEIRDAILSDSTPFAGANIALIYSKVDTEIASIIATLGSAVGASLSADIAGVQADTDNLQTRIPAALTTDGLMKSDTLRVGGTLQTAGDLAGLLATIAAYIDTEVAAIKAKTDNLPPDPADASDLAASFASLASTLATIASYIDTEVAAIKAKTDNLPSDPADASDIAILFAAVPAAVWNAVISGGFSAGAAGLYIQALLAAIQDVQARIPAALTANGNIKADTLRVAGTVQTAGDLATLLATLATYVDTEVAAIKAKTDNLPAAFPTNFGVLAIDASGLVTVKTMRKNVAFAGFPFMMLDTDGEPVAGKTVTATRSLNGSATFAACANAPTEMAGGAYAIDFADTDLNGSTVFLRFTAPGCRDTDLTIVLQG